MSDAQITIRQLESGYYHIRGRGPCNYAQVPSLESDPAEYSHPEASPKFLALARQAVREARDANPT
ncbi:MAG: hypothetical protein MUE60_16550 [Candidatus Eisenbacteria bacterium]|nr:hypothetical protein [Candidatus Eisenbacteria bacterium]